MDTDDPLWNALESLQKHGYDINFHLTINIDHAKVQQFQELVSLGLAEWQESHDGRREWFKVTEAGKKALQEHQLP